MEKVTTITTYTCAGSALVFGLSANEVAAFLGLLLGFLTFVVNAWFKYKAMKLHNQLMNEETEVFRLELQKLKGDIENVNRRNVK